jgi:hypothetical protein
MLKRWRLYGDAQNRDQLGKASKQRFGGLLRGSTFLLLAPETSGTETPGASMQARWIGFAGRQLMRNLSLVLMR